MSVADRAELVYATEAMLLAAPPLGVFRRARSGIFPTWTWECGWFALQICATSCGASRSSAGRDRQRQQLVLGRSPVRLRGVSDAAVVITMTTPGVRAISMQGAKQWKDSDA